MTFVQRCSSSAFSFRATSQQKQSLHASLCPAVQQQKALSGPSGTYRSVGRRIGSNAGGLGLESQAGRIRGKSTPSLCRHKHPAIKSLWPPEHHAGQFHPDQKDPSESNKNRYCSPPPALQDLDFPCVFLLSCTSQGIGRRGMGSFC